MAKKKKRGSKIQRDVYLSKKVIKQKWQRLLVEKNGSFDQNEVERRTKGEIETRNWLKEMFKHKPKDYDKMIRKYNEANRKIAETQDVGFISLKQYVKNFSSYEELAQYEMGVFKKDRRYYKIRKEFIEGFSEYIKNRMSDTFQDAVKEKLNESLRNILKTQGYKDEEIDKTLEKFAKNAKKKDYNKAFSTYKEDTLTLDILNSTV